MKQKSKTTKLSLFDRLAEICDGLIYISETDARVEPFIANRMKDTRTRSLLEYLEIRKAPKIETKRASDFFERLSVEREWYTEEQRGSANKFGELNRIFENELTDATVIRLGKIQIDIYAIGRDKEGNVLGIKTQAVET